MSESSSISFLHSSHFFAPERRKTLPLGMRSGFNKILSPIPRLGGGFKSRSNPSSSRAILQYSLSQAPLLPCPVHSPHWVDVNDSEGRLLPKNLSV